MNNCLTGALRLLLSGPWPDRIPTFTNLLQVQVQVQVQVILRPTVSWPVRLGVVLLLERVTRCHISLSDNYFFYFFPCRAPSLMRGRDCNLPCNDASSISSYIAADGLSVSSSWCRAPYFNFFVCQLLSFFLGVGLPNPYPP
jgi:hypothetical protein